MLQKFAFVFIFLFSLEGNCQFFSGLDLRMYDNSPLSVSIDNQPFTSPSNRMLLSHLFPGAHLLTVHATPYGKWPQAYSNVYFHAIITIPYNAQVVAFLDEYRRFQVSGVLPLYLLPESGSVTVQQSMSQKPGFYQYKKYNLLDTNAFSALDNQLRKPASSAEKLMLLKLSLVPNQVTSAGILSLMQRLDFDVERLEFAIYAYYFTLDKDNYHLLEDGFIFKGTARELFEKISHF